MNCRLSHHFPNSSFLRGVCVLAVLLILCSCDRKPAAQLDLYPAQETRIKYQVDWQKALYTKRIEQFKKEPIGKDKVVLLGNSLTEGGGDWGERFGVNFIINRGISGDITEGVLVRLGEIFHYQPKAVFLLIGVNDIFNADHPNRQEITTQYVAQNIICIAQEITSHLPETSVFIQTLLPVNKEIYFKEKGWFPEHAVPLNRQINEINELLKRSSGHEVIDLHSAFVDGEGNLDKIYTTDGVHLSEAGYKLWVKILTDYVTPYSHNSRIKN